MIRDAICVFTLHYMWHRKRCNSSSRFPNNLKIELDIRIIVIYVVWNVFAKWHVFDMNLMRWIGNKPREMSK